MRRSRSTRAGARAAPADTLYVPADRDDLAAFLRQLPATEPLTVLGLGSNTLVRDGGVRGTVVVMHNPGAVLAVADGLVYADATVAGPKLARFAANHDCAEAEFLAGVPGTVGGALAMNAGCYGGETWNYVARVEVLTRDGRFVVRTPDAYAIGYRSVRLRTAATAASVGVQPDDGQRSTASSPPRGSAFPRATPRRRARASRNCSRAASRRSRSRCRTPAACSAIRPATTPRGSSRPAGSRATRSAARACRRCTRTSS